MINGNKRKNTTKLFAIFTTVCAFALTGCIPETQVVDDGILLDIDYNEDNIIDENEFTPLSDIFVFIEKQNTNDTLTLKVADEVLTKKITEEDLDSKYIIFRNVKFVGKSDTVTITVDVTTDHEESQTITYTKEYTIDLPPLPEGIDPEDGVPIYDTL